MDIRPILSTLRRHKTAAALIVIEVALTCAIVCNAVFLIADRIGRIDAPTGAVESELLDIEISGIGADANADALTRQDLLALRGLAGVKSAVAFNQVLFGHSSTISSIDLAPSQAHSTLDAAVYKGGEGALQTLGLRLVAGRDFLPDEYQDQSVVESNESGRIPAVVLNRAVAERLFPGKEAVGQSVYLWGTAPTRVVGVVEQLVSPDPGYPPGELAALLPLRPSYRSGSYVLRVDPAQRASVLKAAVAALEHLDNRRIVVQQASLTDMRNAYYQQDRAMAWLLAAVCAALLIVTALGIVGLASFWVQQRTRMIGTRRALGATRGQILRYFQTENLLLTSIGIVLGMFGAYGINQVLMTHYELTRLPLVWLPVGAIALWLLGQIAVLGPALRAAALPPVAVMRAG